MQIIFKKEVADQLKDKYTVLELETFKVDMPDGTTQDMETFCVVPADKIPLTEMAALDTYKNLHSEFVKSYNEQNYKLCNDIAEHLLGKFSGELDSFYNTILDRINNVSS
jgi:hypothetical protein